MGRVARRSLFHTECRMPLTLWNSRRGESISIDKARILNGPQPHRPARVYLVPHNRSWYVIPLTPEGSVTLPGEPPRTHLHFGDELTVGGLLLEVEEATVLTDSPLEAGGGNTACRFEVIGQGRALTTTGVVLFGSAEHCDFHVEAAFGIAPVHAALARAEGRWVLYDLVRSGSQAEAPPWVALRDGDCVRVGPLEMHFEIFPLEELEGATADTATVLASAETADMVVATEHDAQEPLEVMPSDPVIGPASLVCRWVQIAAKARTPAETPLMPVPKLPHDPREIGPVFYAQLKTLAEFATRLALRQQDKSLLVGYTQFLTECGYSDLARLMVRRVFHLDQADPHAAAAVAEAYLAAGCEPGSPTGERQKRLAEAQRFALVAAQLGGNRLNFDKLLAAIAVEQTLVRMKLPTDDIDIPARRAVPGGEW